MYILEKIGVETRIRLRNDDAYVTLANNVMMKRKNLPQGLWIYAQKNLQQNVPIYAKGKLRRRNKRRRAVKRLAMFYLF